MLTSPLLFAAGTFWATLGSLKTRDKTSRRKLPGDERVEGGSCLYHVSSLHFAEMWLACDAAIYYLWWWITQSACRRSHLWGVVGDGWALTGAEPRGGDARYRPLGGEGRRRVDQWRTVAKSRAHNAWLAANQLLVHMQSHRSWGIGEA